MAYQIAFDMYESATQQFLNNVVQAVRKTAPIPSAVIGRSLFYSILTDQNNGRNGISEL